MLETEKTFTKSRPHDVLSNKTGNGALSKINLLLVLLSLTIFVIHIFHICDTYGLTMTEDELGYWGNAAFIAGKTWGNVLNDTAYYSFGYSLILALLLKLPLSGVAIYRSALVLNSLYVVASFWISQYLFRKLLPQVNEFYVIVAAATACLYSNLVVQSYITWPENFLTLMIWLLILQAYLVSEKVSPIRIIVFILELLFLYSIHMRTLPVVAAGAVYVLWVVIKGIIENRKKRDIAGNRNVVGALLGCLIGLALFLVLFAVIGKVKGVLQNTLYISTTDSALANDYGSMLDSFLKFDWFKSFAVEIFTNIYYVWTASLGLVPLGIIAAVYALFKRKKADSKGENAGIKGENAGVMLFVLLSFAGEFLLSAYNNRCLWTVDRLDRLIYGRYFEILFPFFIVYGMLALTRVKELKSYKISLAIFMLVYICISGIMIFRVYAFKLDLSMYYQSSCAAGLYGIYTLVGFRPEIISAVALILMLVIVLAVGIATRVADRKDGVRRWDGFGAGTSGKIIFGFLGLLLSGLFVASGYASIGEYIDYQHNSFEALYENREIFSEIDASGGSVTYMTGSMVSTRGTMQMYLMNTPMRYISYQGEIIKDLDTDYVILERLADEAFINRQAEELLLSGRYEVYCESGIDLVYKKLEE